MIHLSVRARIALTMSFVLAASGLTAGLTAMWARDAADAAERARVAERSARASAHASQRITEFASDARALSLTLSAGAPRAASTALYGALQGSERTAGDAVAALAPGDEVSAREVRDQWQDLRRFTYAWINREAEAAGSPLRLVIADNDRVRAAGGGAASAAVTTGGPELAELREAVRQRTDSLKDGRIRLLALRADAGVRAAVAQELVLRERSARWSVGALLVTFLVAVALSLWLYRTIIDPLERARRFAESVTKGDLGARMPSHPADEIGALTTAVEQMKDTVAFRIDMMREMAGAVIVTAEGVRESSLHAHAAVRANSVDRERVADDVISAAARANTLVELATQMLRA